MPETFDLLAATTAGLESVAARELNRLGYEAKGVGVGRVHFRGDALAIARANLWLRSADRVLVRVASFPAPDFDALFETTRALPWEDWIPRDFAFPVDGRSVKSTLTSVPACQRTVKKAIVERLFKAHRTTTLPETGPVVRVEVALRDDIATLTLDTSGVGLHKRGYRPVVGEASLKETLAAGLVLLSVWTPDRPLVDPFCGTGTIAIEAALAGLNIAPGLARAFDAERWPRVAEAWARAREEAAGAPRGALAHAIHASDVDERALAIARAAARAAGVERHVHFKLQPFDQLASKAEHGCVITNPPYGVRLGEGDDALYASMPGVFARLPTWSFHILTARLDLESIFAVRAARRRKLYNATIECTYFTFLAPRRDDPRDERRERADDDEQGTGEARPIGSTGEGPAVDAGEAAAKPGLSGDAQSDAPASRHRPDAAPASRAAPPGQRSAFAAAVLRERDERELADFAARLAKNARHLRRYADRGVHCYRVYERDCPDVPLIIDRYEDHAHVAEYEREHGRTPPQQAQWWARVVSIVADALQIPETNVHAKRKERQRDFSQHEKLGDSGRTLVVREGGLRFEVNLDDYADTGLFLDHRLTRQMVREQARGKRFLNLFCYTGSFTVYAASAGAASTTSVDLSNTYLAWARRNLALNGLDGAAHHVARSDVLEFLRAQGAKAGARASFDLVVVDPPTYSRSKATEEDWEVAVDHADLFRLLTPLLAADAVVYFSTNFRRFKLDEGALAALGLRAKEITRQTIPPEYRNERVHRCWRITRGP